MMQIPVTPADYPGSARANAIIGSDSKSLTTCAPLCTTSFVRAACPAQASTVDRHNLLQKQPL